MAFSILVVPIVSEVTRPTREILELIRVNKESKIVHESPNGQN